MFMNDLSLRVILRIFLILEHFEPRYSYKGYSYKKNGVMAQKWHKPVILPRCQTFLSMSLNKFTALKNGFHNYLNES